MERATPTFHGLDADQLTQLAREAVANAVASNTRAGIPLTGYVDGRVQTIQASDPRIAKFLQKQSAGLCVPSIQIECDPDTGLLWAMCQEFQVRTPKVKPSKNSTHT